MGLFLFADRPALLCGWVNFPMVWKPCTKKAEVTPPREVMGVGQGEIYSWQCNVKKYQGDVAIPHVGLQYVMIGVVISSDCSKYHFY